MRLLYCGDIVGRPGRAVVAQHLPDLRRDLSLDLVVVCGENAAHGFGITQKICEFLYDLGVDVITTGNHVWDQREIIKYISQDPRLLRPLNYIEGTPGRGCGVFETSSGQKVLVAQVICRLFMKEVDDPFHSLTKCFQEYGLGFDIDAAIIDIHGEATSEKAALAHWCDGKASLAVGSHSHVPTADARILGNGTAFQSDAGMCGVYDSVIGMKKEIAIRRFTSPDTPGLLEPAKGEPTLCGVYVETDDKTGLTLEVRPIRVGGDLIQTEPD